MNRSFIKAAKTSSIIFSAAMCVIGVLLIALPGFFAEAVGLILGISAIVYGCSRLFAFFFGDPLRAAFRSDLAAGIMLIALGVILLTNPGSVMAVISVAVGIFTLADGVFKIQTAAEAKRLGYGKWWVALIFALVTCVLGFIMMFRPGEGGDILMIMLGISLLSDGVTNLVTIFTAARFIRELKQDINTIDVDGTEK